MPSYQFSDPRPLTRCRSSHNTYLLSKQLFGESSAGSYTHVLRHYARCVEIDVWPHPASTPNVPKEPIVTHGHTFSRSVPFREVCKAIGEGTKADDWPVLVSLECHVEIEGQKHLVDIMKEEWGDKLVQGELEGVSDDNKVTPGELKGRIVVIVRASLGSSPKLTNEYIQVEYYPPPVKGAENDSSSSSDSSSEYSDSEEAKALQSIRERKKEQGGHRCDKIGPELAALGIYGKSVKPKKNWLMESAYFSF
jgi:phosphatidylinositol phospholipase C delta